MWNRNVKDNFNIFNNVKLLNDNNLVAVTLFGMIMLFLVSWLTGSL